jgi:2-keto-3-deoxy-6-phosphogluconate aldolase
MVVRFDPLVASDLGTGCACDPDLVPGSGFGDIASSLHREAIDCAAWWGVVNGFSPTAFVPSGNITRAQVASMLARALRAAGVDLPTDAANAFPDDDGSVHEADINALADAGVILGQPDGNFNPSGDVSRAQVASMVARAYLVAAGTALEAGTNAFTNDTGSVHEADINAVAGAGWVNGVGGGLFNPDSNATRAQFSSIIAPHALDAGR